MRRCRRVSSAAEPRSIRAAGSGRDSVRDDGIDAEFAGAGADRARTLAGAAARATIFHDSFGGIHSGHRVGTGAITGATRHASLEAVSTFVRHGKFPTTSSDRSLVAKTASHHNGESVSGVYT
jgi:hypothetical protein